jgi:hypothetical protein
MRFHSATASLFGTIFSSPAPLMGHGIDIGAEASSKQAGSKAPIQTRSRDRHSDRFRENAELVTTIDAAFR